MVSDSTIRIVALGLAVVLGVAIGGWTAYKDRHPRRKAKPVVAEPTIVPATVPSVATAAPVGAPKAAVDEPEPRAPTAWDIAALASKEVWLVSNTGSVYLRVTAVSDDELAVERVPHDEYKQGMTAGRLTVELFILSASAGAQAKMWRVGVDAHFNNATDYVVDDARAGLTDDMHYTLVGKDPLGRLYSQLNGALLSPW